MVNNYGISEEQLNLVKKQAARRAELRQEFLKQRTNPYKHAAESGYVFDSAIQRFMSMKVTQPEYFVPTLKNGLFALASVVPMFVFGYLIYCQREAKEAKIRNGELRYRDRDFKLI